MKRRNFLLHTAGGGLAAAGTALGANRVSPPQPATPSEVQGPFYPVFAPADQDFDLTQVEGYPVQAQGRPIFISGTVQDTSGQAVEGAAVDLWQANAAGRYRHPHDRNPAPLDEGFQGWAIVPSGKAGRFRFRTIFPGAYPVAEGWDRPPHIHFKVSKRGYEELVTQMYFPGQALNQKDALLQRKSPEEQRLLIAERVSRDPETYLFRITLQKV